MTSKGKEKCKLQNLSDLPQTPYPLELWTTLKVKTFKFLVVVLSSSSCFKANILTLKHNSFAEKTPLVLLGYLTPSPLTLDEIRNYIVF